MMTTNNKRKLRRTAAAADIARLACRVTHISISQKNRKIDCQVYRWLSLDRTVCLFVEGAFDNRSEFLSRVETKQAKVLPRILTIKTKKK